MQAWSRCHGFLTLCSESTCARGVGSHDGQRRPQTHRNQRHRHCQQHNLPGARLLARVVLCRAGPLAVEWSTRFAEKPQCTLLRGAKVGTLPAPGRKLRAWQMASWALPATVQGATGAHQPMRQPPQRAVPPRCTLALPSVWPRASQLPHRAANSAPGDAGAPALQQKNQAESVRCWLNTLPGVHLLYV